jgi:hypothetical protein
MWTRSLVILRRCVTAVSILCSLDAAPAVPRVVIAQNAIHTSPDHVDALRGQLTDSRSVDQQLPQLNASPLDDSVDVPDLRADPRDAVFSIVKDRPPASVSSQQARHGRKPFPIVFASNRRHKDGCNTTNGRRPLDEQYLIFSRQEVTRSDFALTTSMHAILAANRPLSFDMRCTSAGILNDRRCDLPERSFAIFISSCRTTADSDDGSAS